MSFVLQEKVIYKGAICIIDKFISKSMVKIRLLSIIEANFKRFDECPIILAIVYAIINPEKLVPFTELSEILYL